MKLMLLFSLLLISWSQQSLANEGFGAKCSEAGGTYSGPGGGCICPGGLAVNPYFEKCGNAQGTRPSPTPTPRMRSMNEEACKELDKKFEEWNAWLKSDEFTNTPPEDRSRQADTRFKSLLCANEGKYRLCLTQCNLGGKAMENTKHAYNMCRNLYSRCCPSEMKGDGYYCGTVIDARGTGQSGAPVR